MVDYLKTCCRNLRAYSSIVFSEPDAQVSEGKGLKVSRRFLTLRHSKVNAVNINLVGQNFMWIVVMEKKQSVK